MAHPAPSLLMRVLRAAYLGGLLWASALVQGYLLATDAFLREAQPLLAAALALFIGVDVALASPLTARDRFPAGLALPWAALQLLGLLLNPLMGPQVGIPPAAFADYLFGLWAYDALVTLRALQVLVGLALVGGLRQAVAGLRPRRRGVPGRV